MGLLSRCKAYSTLIGCAVACAYIGAAHADGAPSATDPKPDSPPSGWRAPKGGIDAVDTRHSVGWCFNTDSACRAKQPTTATAPERERIISIDVPVSDLPKAIVKLTSPETKGPKGAVVLRIVDSTSKSSVHWVDDPEPMDALPPRRTGLLAVDGVENPWKGTDFRFGVAPADGDAGPRPGTLHNAPFKFEAIGYDKVDGTVPYDVVTGTNDELHPRRVKAWSHGYAKPILSGMFSAIRVAGETEGSEKIVILRDGDAFTLGSAASESSLTRVGFIGWSDDAKALKALGLTRDTSAEVFADVTHGESEASAVVRLRIIRPDER